MTRKTLHIPVFLILLVIPFFLSAQVPQWSWAKGVDSGGDEGVFSVAHDPVSGGVIAVGSYSNNISASIPGLTGSLGSQDGLVVKYDPLGNVIWAFSIGGTGWDAVLDVATDPLGEIYVCGQFNGTANFDGTTPSIPATLVSAGGNDGFIAKYSASGVLLWIRQIACTQSTFPTAVAAGPNGVYLIGWFDNANLSIGALSVTNIQN